MQSRHGAYVPSNPSMTSRKVVNPSLCQDSRLGKTSPFPSQHRVSLWRDMSHPYYQHKNFAMRFDVMST